MGTKNQMDQSLDQKSVAMRVSRISIIINVLLSLLKLVAGVVASSGAMISDAVHSLSDVFSTFIVIIGVNISNKKSDKEHQYGHERLECVASIVLAIILGATGLGIGYTGFQKIIGQNGGELVVPGILALVAAVISIIVKEWMYWFTRAAAKQVNSGALMADAWHHRSDALSSIGSFIGIFGARLGFPILDPIASVVICLFIEKAAYDIFKDAIDKMIDKSCDEETVSLIRSIILGCDGVEGIDEIRTRLFGAKIYVDVEILVAGDLSLLDAHDIAEDVHLAIENQVVGVKHCMVHVNPNKSEV
ncbi:cobalt-zinc-cadmium resistance protein [Lachnospiraceae bacterium KM106-2]|nr:cobalt-zinc-cadmium resistance protein [Lachnospiraceae bacterium KM106-2]